MLIDTHAHIDRYELAGEGALESALDEIALHGILTISNSMDLPSYERNLAIAETCDLVLPIFGVHPWNAPQVAGRLDDLRGAVERSPMIGEIGLDHHFVEDASQYPAQRRVFEFFLDAASGRKKIVILHTKGAERDVLELLERYEIRRAIVHWYSGPLDVFRELAARGAYFTVGVELLYSAHIQAIAREVPSGRLLTETDNPGGPKGFIGGPGTPALIEQVVQALADVRGTTAGTLAGTVRANLLALAGDDPWLVDTGFGARLRGEPR